jgi:hypothetical protein
MTYKRDVLENQDAVYTVETHPVFTVRIVYKSGYTHDFECFTFDIDNGKYTYIPASGNTNIPVMLGPNEIATVWQLGVKFPS